MYLAGSLGIIALNSISYSVKNDMRFLPNKELTSYGVGLLQSKAYRALNVLTSNYLSELNLSPIDWAFLGVVYDAKKSNQDISQKQVAEILGTSEAFVVKLVKKMSDQKYLSQKKIQEDKRMRLLVMNPFGMAFIEKHEPRLRSFMKEQLKGISHIHVLGYLKTIEALADKEQKGSF